MVKLSQLEFSSWLFLFMEVSKFMDLRYANGTKVVQGKLVLGQLVIVEDSDLIPISNYIVDGEEVWSWMFTADGRLLVNDNPFFEAEEFYLFSKSSSDSKEEDEDEDETLDELIENQKNLDGLCNLFLQPDLT